MFHPQIIGKPGHMIVLEKLLKHIKKQPDVWIATAEKVAHRVLVA